MKRLLQLTNSETFIQTKFLSAVLLFWCLVSYLLYSYNASSELLLASILICIVGAVHILYINLIKH